MKRPKRPYRFLGDPFTVLALAIYALHQALRLHWDFPAWVSAYGNDLLMIPCALPCVLWIYTRCGLRPRDAGPPSGAEVLAHTILWGSLAEGFCPAVGIGVRDPWDLVAYAVGACVGGIYWNGRRRSDLLMDATEIAR